MALPVLFHRFDLGRSHVRDGVVRDIDFTLGFPFLSEGSSPEYGNLAIFICCAICLELLEECSSLLVLHITGAAALIKFPGLAKTDPLQRRLTNKSGI